MTNTDEFKIITEVELDSKEAEDKLEKFISNNKNKSIPIELELKELSNALDADLKDLGKKISNTLSIDPKNVENIQKLESSLKNVKEYLKDMSGILGDKKLRVMGDDNADPKMFERSAKALDNYAKKIQEGSEKIEKAKKKIKEEGNSKPTEIDVDVDKAKNKLERFGNTLELLKYNLKNLDINIIGVDNIDKVIEKVDDLYDKAKQNAQDGLAIRTPEVDFDLTNLKEVYKALRKIQTQYERFETLKIDLGDNIDADSIKKIEDAFREAFNKISKMDGLELDFNLDNITSSFKRLNGDISKVRDNFSGIKKIASDFKDEIASYTIGDVLGDWVTDFARGVGASYLELDRSIREIKKVAEPSDINTVEKLDEIRTKAIDVAKEVGMTSSDVQNSIASALQAGIGGMQESIAVAKQSMILANVGDMTQDSASQAINTIVKSFNLQPLKEYDVQVGKSKEKTTELKNAMDLLNFAGNNYAIGTDGIAEAMKRGGAVLASYNVSLEDSVGLITATNEALQNPERVGNGLKTIAINLAGIKTSAKDGTMGLNKTALALKEIAGVDVYKNKKTGELKNMVEVLDEVKKKWDNLSDAEQKGLSEAIAGKQQATVFQSLMQNYKAFNKIRQEFSNGEHFKSAEKENEQFVNSIDGKLNKLKETWVDTFTTIINSEFTYKLLDGLIAVSEQINEIIKSLEGMDMLTPLATFLFSSGKNMFSNLNLGKEQRRIETFGDVISEALNPTITENGFKRVGKDAEETTKKVSKVKQTFKSFESSIENGTLMQDGFKGLISSLKNVGKEGTALKGVLSKLGGAVGSVFSGFVSGAVVTAGIEAVRFATEKAYEKMNQLKISKEERYGKVTELQEENKGLQETQKWLEQNKERYNELIQKKREYALSGKELTGYQKSDMEELRQIQQEIADKMPELVVGYKSDGSPILAMADDFDTLNRKIETTIKSNERLINSQKKKIGKIASEEIRYGEYGGTSLMRELKNANERYNLNLATQTAQFEKKWSSSVNELGAFNGKKYSEQLRKQEETVEKHYEELLTLTESYYEKEREVQEANAIKISEKNNYKKLNDTDRESLDEVIGLVNWGKFNEGEQRTWIKGFNNLAKNFANNKGTLEAYRKEWEKLNEEYSNTGDQEAYSKGLQSVAEGMVSIMGLDTSKVGTIKKGLMQVIEPLDPMSRKLQKFLGSYNKSMNDVLNNDTLAVKLRDQFQAIQDAMDIFKDESSFKANGALTFQAVLEISEIENLPQKIRDFANKAKKDGVTKIESEMIITQIEIAQSGGITNKGAKSDIAEILNNPNKPIKKDIQINPNFTLSKERLEGIRNWNKLNPSDKITADDLFDMNGIEQASKKITNDIFGILYKNKNNGAKIKVAIEGLGLDTEQKAINLKTVLDKIPANKRLNFIENFGEAFARTENLKEAIDSIPAWKKIEYNVGLENEPTLQSLKDTYKELKSKNVKIKLDAQGFEALKIYEALFRTFGDKVYKIPIDVVMKSDSVDDVFTKLKNLGYTDKKIKAKFGIDTSEIEKAQNKVEKLAEETDKLSKKEGKIKINGEEVEAKIEDVKTWAELSREVSEGNYEMKMKIDVGDAVKNIGELEKGLSKFHNKNYKATFTVLTAKAYNKIKALLTKSKEYNGKNFHASFIAHTVNAYNKIKALLSKAKQYSGKTFHASFIAHTAHAYEKVSALLSKAQSYGGKTYHASMTVTKNVVTNEKGSKSVPVNVSDATRTVTTTYANDGIMPIDDPMTIGDENQSVNGRARNSNTFSYKFSDASKLLKIPQSVLQDAYSAMHEMVNKVIKETVGKTTKLADTLKNGTKVVLTSITSSVKDILDSLKYDIDRLKELNNTIARISHSIDMLDKRMSNSVGSERIAFLQRQNDELKKRIKLNEELLKQKKREKEAYKAELKKKGLKFTADDNISNYDETMLKLKREAESLDKTLEKLSESNEKRNEKQQKADEKKRKEIEKRKKEIEELIKLIDAFNQVTFGDIFDIESSIVDDANKVEENLLEQKRLEYEKWVVGLESAFKNVNKELQKLNNQLAMLDIQMEHAWGKEKLDLMKQQIDLIKKSQNALKDNITVMESSKNSVQKKLMEYGFKFNQNGDIEDFARTMQHLKDTSKEFDTIQGLVDGYFDLYLEQIPEAERELAKFNNQLKDIYKEQLNATKELEDKIIDMYKKQLEERKKLIDEELDKRLDALKKEQDAYKKTREEQKYKDDFNEQTDKIKELEKQIDLAKRDTSLTGQKKLKDLLKQLEDEKKKLDEITQDRIDQQVDNAFKDEEDRLQQGAEDEKDRLDKEFSDEELLKKAQEAIKNGLFIGIDGEVKNLQSALLEYIDKWEEGLSATGALIKSELITKLEIANDTIKDFAGKLEDLGIGNLNTNDIYTKSMMSTLADNRNGNTKSINFNEPLVVVQGSVNDGNIDQIERVIKEAIDKNTREILRKI